MIDSRRIILDNKKIIEFISFGLFIIYFTKISTKFKKKILDYPLLKHEILKIISINKIKS